MSSRAQKFTITPLDRCDWRIEQSLPIELGHGLSIQNYKGRLPSISHWDEYLSKNDSEGVSQWSLCLEHRYFGTPRVQETEDESSRRFIATATSCLRFIISSDTDGHHCLQLERLPTGELEPFHFLRPVSRTVLEQLESFGPEFDPSSFAVFKSWLDWIVDFAADGRRYLPLWISLNFAALSYREHYKPMRHVLRVMALEALFSDKGKFGKRAFISRVLPFVTGWDLYAPYHSSAQHLPQKPVDAALLEDIVKMRNDIAHGAPIRPEWIAQRVRRNSDDITYADELTDAVTALLRMVWAHILTNNLQKMFSDKAAVAKGF